MREALRPNRSKNVFYNFEFPEGSWCFCTKTATQSSLTVGLGNSFELVLLLDGVGVGASLGGVHDLVSEALGDGLDVSESSFSSTGADEPDSLKKLEV